MIKKFIIPIFLCAVILLSGCDIIMQPSVTAPPQVTTQGSLITAVALDTQTPQYTQATEVPTASPPPVATLSPTTVITNPPSPPNTMSFYSCYAFMVSYNPANGWAEFDYFYMLKDEEAIEYLVDHESWSQSDAEDYVNDFGDGEYVCQNDNPGLRTIDLDLVPLKLMYHPNGTMSPDGATNIPSTSADVTALYNLDPDYLFVNFFFYIHCDSDGNITLVEQVYWC